MRSLSVLFAAAGIAVLAYLAVCAILYAMQRSLIYFPQPRALRTRETTQTLKVDGAELDLTVRAQAGPRAVVYFGGNAEDVSQSLAGLAAAFPGRALYLMHYRGYGASTGQPSEAALHANALALYDRVQAEHPEVLVIGRSLGSGVAIRLAAQRPVAGLVLVTPYDSLVGIGARQFPWLPVRWLLRDRYESSLQAPNVQAPTRLLVAEHDATIPAESSRALFARFRGGMARYDVIPGTDHNSILQSDAYRAALEDVK